MLGLLKRKKQKKEYKKVGKAQPDFMDAKPEGIDFASPSIIKELRPKEMTADNIQANDYIVEIGGTSVPVRYYRSFFAEITGGTTWAGMLDDLLLGQFGQGDVDLAIHVRPADNYRELDEINRRIAGLRSDLGTVKDEGKRDAMYDEIADLKERQRRLRTNIERSFRVSIQITASGTDYKEFRKYCNSMVAKFANKGIILRSADGFQLDALKNMIPTAEKVNVHKEHTLSLESSNLADLFPFGNGGISHRTGIIIGRDLLGRPVYFDRWHPSLTNQHMIILGRSGAGKTYTMMTIIVRSVLAGIRHAIIDWKGEFKDLMLATGCPFIELSESSKDRINPYDVDITEDLDGSRYIDIEEASNGVQALVFKMISTYDPSALTGEVKVFIGKAIREQYADATITRDINSLYTNAHKDGQFGRRKKPMPTLSGLYEKMAQSEIESVRKAAEMLRPFTKHGNSPSYAIFDGQSTVDIGQAPMFAFAINKLDKEIMRPIGLFATARWLTENFAKKNPEQRKSIVIEECQNIFDDKDFGGYWAESSYREGRSTNTSVVAVTQGLEVFDRSEAGIAALKNSPIKIIGIQEEYDIDAVQGKLALSEGEADFLVNQATKGWVVLKIDNESTIVKIDACPMENMLFTTDPNDPAYWQRKEYIKQKLQLGLGA